MILIKNATIYDGTGGEPFRSDILIDDDTIALIKPAITLPADITIDAAGLAAAPGFIDIHSHSEYSLLADPLASSKLMQGVTTDVSGNCGMSAAPLIGEAADARAKELEELGLTLSWSEFNGYFDLLSQSRPAINFATLCGHGSLRASVMGYANRMPTEDEMLVMERLLAEAMQAGAFGLSTGLIYPPGVYADTGELVRLGKTVAKHGGIYASHMRSEGAGVVAAIDEALTVGREAGVPVQISHIKTSGPPNWHLLPEMIRLIEAARASGMDVTADRYPYNAGSTDLDAVLHSWTYEGGPQAELARLLDPDTRKKITDEINAEFPDAEKWDRVMIASVVTEANRALEGMLLSDAAKLRGQSPVDALIDILIEEELRVGAIFFGMSEANLREFYRRDWVMIGSDATARGMTGITAQGKPHPRAFGSFPRVLGVYARDEAVIPLATAVQKMTSMPADKLGLTGRGYLQVGKFADIVLFNPDTVVDKAEYADPYRYSVGIEYVLVNGVVAVENGLQTDARAGRALRRGNGEE